MQLVIVESPTKAKTISKFLGADFIVKSSFGHVRDLPKSELGIDVDHDFVPKYIIPTKAKKNVSELKKDAAHANTIILATDPDREGEAIAWHLKEALKLDELLEKNADLKIERVVFHEITKSAIMEALEHPGKLDDHLVDAQQARRILDRLVGYKLSPLLWKRYYRGLSAGRVQSVAVRLVVEREREIEKFKPEEYWTITAFLIGNDKEKPIESNLVKIGDKTLDQLDIKDEKSAAEVVEAVKNASWVVSNVEKNEVNRSPSAPFTTSTLQQEASKKLHMSSKQTMMFAQQLYEAGYITYMRTDSVTLSEQSLAAASKFISSEYGANYHHQRKFKTKSKNAQEAHEAVRPTEPSQTPDSLKSEISAAQMKVYDLIWRRFLASQMAPAIFDATTIEIEADKYTFRASGSTIKFDGWLKIYPAKFTEHELPVVKAKEKLDLKEIKPEQHFTKPPARFNEASLIKTLEKEGIGRPSTYAPIISTIVARKYVEKDRSRYFHPTEIGMMVNDFLVENFPGVVDIKFTSHLEDELDDIALGKAKWVPVIKEFYEPFEKLMQEKTQLAKDGKTADEEKTDLICEKCGHPMIVKRGRFGKFIACSNFPECKNIHKEAKPAPEPTGEKCEKCGEGEMVIRTGRFGKFKACSNYPKCKNTQKIAKDDAAAAPAVAEPKVEVEEEKDDDHADPEDTE